MAIINTKAIHRMLLGAGTAGVLVVGTLGLPATAWSATPGASVASVSLAASTGPIEAANLHSVPTWCPFGTNHGKGSGCRGGSVNDNKRVNDSVKDTGDMFKDAGECAIEGVAKGVESKPKSFWGLAKKSEEEGFKCGTKSPRGKLW
jgi:hypothetical protein